MRPVAKRRAEEFLGRPFGRPLLVYVVRCYATSAIVSTPFVLAV